MEACAKPWGDLRASLDGRFGPSKSANLAAYWKTASADNNAGVLSLTYAPLAAE